MELAATFVYYFCTVYLLAMFIWALISWLPQISPSLAYNSTVVSVRNFLDSIILPWVKLFSFIKPVQMGNMMFDLSFLAAMLVLVVAQRYLPGLILSL